MVAGVKVAGDTENNKGKKGNAKYIDVSAALGATEKLRSPVRCRNAVRCPLGFSETDLQLTRIPMEGTSTPKTLDLELSIARRMLRQRFYNQAYSPTVCFQIPSSTATVSGEGRSGMYTAWSLTRGSDGSQQPAQFNVNNKFHDETAMGQNIERLFYPYTSASTPRVVASTFVPSDDDVAWGNYRSLVERGSASANDAETLLGGKPQTATFKRFDFRMYCFSFVFPAQDAATPPPTVNGAKPESAAAYRARRQREVGGLFKSVSPSTKLRLDFKVVEDRANKLAAVDIGPAVVWDVSMAPGCGSTEFPSEGFPCAGAGRRCAAGLFCVDAGTCEALKGTGARCSKDDECLSFACSTNDANPSTPVCLSDTEAAKKFGGVIGIDANWAGIYIAFFSVLVAGASLYMWESMTPDIL